jgi:putative membrane protein
MPDNHMKKLTLIGLVLLAVWLQACTGDTNNDAEDNQPMAVTAKDTTKFTIPIDKDDAQFAMQAAVSCMTELEMGKLAMKNGADKRVKNFGSRIVKDHIKADIKLQAIAKAKKINLPTTIDSAEQKKIDLLAKTSGKNFDRLYLNDMIMDHQQNIKLYQKASTQLMDPDLRAFAVKNLPTFNRHLDAINMIKGSIKQ